MSRGRRAGGFRAGGFAALKDYDGYEFASERHGLRSVQLSVPFKRCVMSRISDLEHQVQSLSADELASFRRWFAEFDAAAWDRQFEGDVKAGKLDALGERARQAHASGKSSKL